MGGGLIQDLEAGIVLQDFQDGAIRFPQELQPRRNNGTICTILRLFSRDRRKKNSLRGFAGFQIINAANILRSGGIERGLDLVSFCLRLLYLILGEFDEFL
jgi:hypothetical protein